ncbi:hypothetical protein FACS1894161_3330 [Spirochaetia bacterium]|nr:hypothetical protein FACS1894161_3330 [Spirochaetia bacterium]
MKLSRKTLLWITAGLGLLLIAYALVRQFTGLEIDAKIERYFMDIVIFAALGLFLYNRKLATEERKAREAAEQEQVRVEQQAEAGDEEPDDEDRPHWERGRE